MSTEWATLVRHYLARRDPAVLEQAIAATQEPEIIALLRAVQEHNFETITRLAPALYESLQREERSEEALTVALLATNQQVQLVESYNQFPLEQQSQALEFGLEACEITIRLATLLDDPPCVACYQFTKGNGPRLGRLGCKMV
jgi:hypothetical protein